MPSYYGDDGNNQVSLKAQKDHLYGGRGDDSLSSNVIGNDYWEGGEGDDALIAAGGAFGSFYGGNGNDSISQTFVASSASEMYGGAGDDYIAAGGPATIEGGTGRDALFGAAGDDFIFGGSGSESGLPISGTFIVVAGGALPGLYGGLGNDFMDGGRGDDRVDGGGDNDDLMGGAGIDNLFGDEGDDTMTGGTGGDTFRYRSTDDSRNRNHHDVIRDFERGLDLIDLHEIDGKVTKAGNQAFRFVGDRFDGRPGALVFLPKPHELLGDTNGDRRPDFYVKVVGVDALRAGDFDL